MAGHDARGPTLALLAGPVGAGKTTLALALARTLGWPVVDKDTLKSPMLEAGVPEAIAGRASYDLLFEVGKDLLIRQGFSVILDSPAGYPAVVRRAETLAEEAGASLKFVLCLADPVLRNQRLAERASKSAQLTADAQTLDDGHERWTPLLPPQTLRVRAERPVEELLQRVVPYLRGVEQRPNP